MPAAMKDAEIKFRTSDELKRQILGGRKTLRPDPDTGVTVLPVWMDAPEDEGLYDDLVCAALNSSDQSEDEQQAATDTCAAPSFTALPSAGC